LSGGLKAAGAVVLLYTSSSSSSNSVLQKRRALIQPTCSIAAHVMMGLLAGHTSA
jgi:hypothetical protein